MGGERSVLGLWGGPFWVFEHPVDVFCCFGWDGVPSPFGRSVKIFVFDSGEYFFDVVSYKGVGAHVVVGGEVLDDLVKLGWD